MVPKLKSLYGAKTRFVPMGQKRGLIARLTGRAMASAVAEVEDRAAFARFGL